MERFSNYMNNMCFLILVFLYTSCVKEPMPQDPIEPKKWVQWGWQIDLTAYSQELQQDPLLYKDWVIVGFITDYTNRNLPAMIAFNKFTGEKAWEFIYHSKNTDYVRNILIHGDKIVIKYTDRLVCVVADTREILWEKIYSPNLGSEHPMVFHGDYLYHSENYFEDKADFPFNDSVQLVRYNFFTGQVEKLWGERKEKDSENHPLLNPPVIYNGSREIVIFTKRYLHLGPRPPVDKYAVDVNTKEVVWQDTAYSHLDDAWNTPPILFNGNVIASSDWSLYNWNAETGKLNWKSELYGMNNLTGFSFSGPFLHEDRIYSISNNGKMFCLDAASGNILWQNINVGVNNNGPARGPCNRPIVVDDILYVNTWSDQALILFDANTGKQLERHRQHKYNGRNVLYDEETNTFFVTADDKLLSFKVNK